MGDHNAGARHIIAYDGHVFPSVDDGIVRPAAMRQVRAIVGRLMTDYGLIVTEDNPLRFDLGKEAWGYIEWPMQEQD